MWTKLLPSGKKYIADYLKTQKLFNQAAAYKQYAAKFAALYAENSEQSAIENCHQKR